MGVHESHIQVLLDGKATREAIINGFTSLKDNKDIQRNNPILIYFAGHGAREDAQSDLIGYPKGAHIEMICPADIGGRAPGGKKIPGIHDYTIAALLNQLAEAKGNNIVKCSSKSFIGYMLTYLGM